MQEFLTSVDTSPQIGLDNSIEPTVKNLHVKIDDLIALIDNITKGTTAFKVKYEDQLDNKDKFYKDQTDYNKSKKDDDKKGEPEKEDLPQEIIEDITIGANSIRTALKERYFGREAGK